MLELFSFPLSVLDLGLLCLAALFIGMAKTGVSGAGMLSVPIMAIIFGGKVSSGVVLPILIMADLFGVFYYTKHANWSYLWRLFPAAAMGVVTATYLGNLVDDHTFKLIMSVFVFVSLAIMIWQERTKQAKVPNYLWFALLMGFLGGITTMIGNLAGSVMALYLLSMRLPKNEYIGTAAWFFLVINLFKVPFHVYAWETITTESFLLSVATLPAVAAGAFVGVWAVKRIPESAYRWLVIGTTALAAVVMVV